MTGAKLFTNICAARETAARNRRWLPAASCCRAISTVRRCSTFFPMPLTSDERPPRGSLAAMMMRRFESYKTSVVKPFFNDHFARLDRQIVLVDVLGGANRGAEAVGDLERAMTPSKAFRPAPIVAVACFSGARSIAFSSPRRRPIICPHRATTASKPF